MDFCRAKSKGTTVPVAVSLMTMEIIIISVLRVLLLRRVVEVFLGNLVVGVSD